jgi:hypothetical protein
MNSPLLLEYIHRTLAKSIDETAAWKRNLGVDDQKKLALVLDPKEALKKYMELPNMYVHFGRVNRLGINPMSDFQSTPIGIYSYQLTPEITENLLAKGALPFADDGEFMQIFRARNPEKILHIQTYTEEQLKEDATKLGADQALIESMKDHTEDHSPGSLLYVLTRKLSSKKNDKYMDYNYHNPNRPIKMASGPREWRTLLVNLGYEGLRDDGWGVIHDSEKTQSVFFSSQYIEQVYSSKNPILKSMADHRKQGTEKLGPENLLSTLVADSAKLEAGIKQQIGKSSDAYLLQGIKLYHFKTNMASAKILWKYFHNSKELKARLKLAEELPTPLFYRFKDDEDKNVRWVVVERTEQRFVAALIENEKKQPKPDILLIKILKNKLPKIQRGDSVAST